MTTHSLFFGGSVSQNYEDYLGDFFFEPYALDMAARLDFTGVNTVLELACGTGRLTKHIADAVPANVAFTATDLNTDMMNVARARVTSGRVTWAQADMLSLPFDNESFDLVVCQFGVMLVPDQPKALHEIARILKPGGKLMFSTWTDRDHNRVWAIGDRVLQKFLGPSKTVLNPGPFALSDQWTVLEMLRMAGFSKSDATVVELTGQIESAQKAAYGFINGLPVAAMIQNKVPALMPEILNALESELKAELGDNPLVTPQKAWVFGAVK